MTARDSSRRRSGKVARLLQERELDAVGDELVTYWTAEDDRQKSLRELARYFNERLVEDVLREVGHPPLAGEPANYYRILTEDDVSSGTRIQAKRRLEDLGVDVDALRSAFVSRQAIHTYLTTERGVEYDRKSTNDHQQTINRLKGRLRSVAATAAADVSESTPTVSVMIRVECPKCSRQVPINEFLQSEGCTES